MINPDFSTSRLSKCCNCLLMFFDHWIPRFVLAPIFFIVPSTILVSSLSNTNLYQQLEASLGPQIAGTLKSSHLLIIIWVVLLTYIGRSLFSIIQHFALEDSELTKKDIVSILNTIDVVVQSKCNRFLRNTKQVLKKNLSSSEIFKMITQPDQQIALIVQAIQGIFETLHGNNTEFRVGLMAVKSEKLTDWFVFAPENKPPKTDAEALSNPSSAIMRALKSKSMIIIEDIQEELKKKNKNDRCFIKGSTQPKDQGSILVIPIYCPNTRSPIYMVSIMGNKKGCLLKKNKGLYSWLLDLYIQRIILEHHLLLMKESIHEEEAA